MWVKKRMNKSQMGADVIAASITPMARYNGDLYRFFTF